MLLRGSRNRTPRRVIGRGRGDGGHATAPCLVERARTLIGQMDIEHGVERPQLAARNWEPNPRRPNAQTSAAEVQARVLMRLTLITAVVA